MAFIVRVEGHIIDVGQLNLDRSQRFNCIVRLGDVREPLLSIVVQVRYVGPAAVLC